MDRDAGIESCKQSLEALLCKLEQQGVEGTKHLSEFERWREVGTTYYCRVGNDGCLRKGKPLTDIRTVREVKRPDQTAPRAKSRGRSSRTRRTEAMLAEVAQGAKLGCL